MRNIPKEALMGFQPGDVVQLKCGSPPMIVMEIAADRAHAPITCMWIKADGVPYGYTFPCSVLVAYDNGVHAPPWPPKARPADWEAPAFSTTLR